MEYVPLIRRLCVWYLRVFLQVLPYFDEPRAIFQFFANQKVAKFLLFRNFGGSRIKPINFLQNFTD